VKDQGVYEQIVEDFGLEGWGSVHYDAMFADLDQVPAQNVTTTVNAAGGTTTTYLVPTTDAPLLRAAAEPWCLGGRHRHP